jgi:hypothetical protein
MGLPFIVRPEERGLCSGYDRPDATFAGARIIAATLG